MKASFWTLLFFSMMIVTAQADEIHLDCWIENHPRANVTPAPSHSISVDIDGETLYVTEQGTVIKYLNKNENADAYNDEKFVIVSPTIIKFGHSTKYFSSKFEDSYEEGVLDRTSGQYRYGYGKSPIDISPSWTGLCKKADRKTQF
jgi:hypothetical protein